MTQIYLSTFIIESLLITCFIFYHFLDMIAIIFKMKNEKLVQKPILSDVELLYEIFDSSIYYITIFKHPDFKHQNPYTTIDIYRIEDFKSRKNKRRENYIFSLTILTSRKYFIVDSLKKEDNFSGNEQLKRVELIANKLSIREIVINDGSNIQYLCPDEITYLNIPLGPLKILANGHTWYEENGYIAENQKEVNSFNCILIEQPLSLLYTKLFNYEISYDNSFHHDYLKSFWDKPIKEFFTDFKNRLKNHDVNDIPLVFIVELIKTIVDKDIIKFLGEHHALTKKLG